jgi:hypothetical protein
LLWFDGDRPNAQAQQAAALLLPRRLLTEELRLSPASAAALVVALRYVVPAGVLAATLSWVAR